MPLLKKKPFTPEKPPADLKPDEEIFVCRHTNEIYRSYESFFQRTILCNSCVWSCKYTGKSGLTYSEALESENELEKQGRTLPESIQRAALTVVHHIQRGRLANLCDEVYNYIKDRYQEGEVVDVHYSGKKRHGVIVDVIPPEDLHNLASPTHPPKEKKLSASKSGGESRSATPKKSADSSKTPNKSPAPSHHKAKTPKSRKSSTSEGKEKLSPHESRPSTSGESQTTSKPRRHSSTQDVSPGSSKTPNGRDGLSSPKALKQTTLDCFSEIKSKGVGDKPVQVLNSPKDKSNNTPDLVVIKDDSSGRDEGCQTVVSPKTPKNKTKCLWPLAERYKYEVKLYPEKGSKASKEKPETIIVSAFQVSRVKGAFSRDKLKVFLRISCIRSTPQSDDGFYVVKREFCEKFDLGEPVFVLESPKSKPKKEKSKKRRSSQGPTPEEGSSKKKKRKLTGDDISAEIKKKKKQEREREKQLKKMTPAERQKFLEEEKEKKKRALEEEKEKRKVEKEREKNELRAKREEERVKKKVERDKERERLKEQKRLEALELKEWSKPREDLQLDDLKELPTPIPLETKLPQDMFGDMVMVLEFLNIFASVFDMKDEFPSGLSFALLEEALTEHDAEGVYYDLMQYLLGAILRTHLEEEEDEGLDRMHVTNPDKMELEEEDAGSTATVSAAASIAAAWPLLFQGKALHELIMDPFTCSELLRLHLLSSGARIGCRDASYRWQRRGGFTYSDDAVVEFRHREPNILKALLTHNVYDLGAHDKLKILVALCTQMMTYATARDHMEDGFDRSRKARREWLEDQWADGRREKEEAAARYRRKQEERQRQKEDMERRKKEKEAAGTSSKAEGQTASSQPSQEENKRDDGKNDDEKKKKKGEEKGSKTRRNKDKAQDNSGEPTQKSNGTSKEEELARTKEEEEELARQRKEERRRKDNEFILELAKATAMSGLQALGRDRMFRRYWSFRSLRGLFVEDDDPEMAAFLGGSGDEEESEEEETEGADQTKAVKTEGQSSGNTGPQLDREKNGDGPENAEAAQAKASENDKDAAESKEETAGCAKIKKEGWVARELRGIYGERAPVRWSLFTSIEQLDALMGSLNQRGVRERVLRDNIQQDYQNLAKAIAKCPLIEENRMQKKEAKPKSRRGGRGQPQQSVDKSRYKAMEEFIEANLRDQVLDLEDRVWQGGLGGIKVDDRVAWRKKVENGIYDHLLQTVAEPEGCKRGDGVLVNGDANADELDGSPEEGAHSSVQDAPGQLVANGDVENMDAQEPEEGCEELERLAEKPAELPLSASVPAQLCPVKSEASTPASWSRSGTPTLSLATPLKSVNPVIKELALALLKVEQGIERKYLNPPLGEDEETKKQKQREAAAQALKEFNEMMKGVEERKKKSRKEKKGESRRQADEQGNNTENGEQKERDEDASSSSSEEPAKAKTCLERWAESLLACSSLSQVFVHMNTLDQSIAWSKSVLNARCRLCRRKGDAEHMLLCDACDRGHHMYCLKPPIKQIPEGNWFCSDCRPKETRRSERRRKPVIEDDDEQEEEEEERPVERTGDTSSSSGSSSDEGESDLVCEYGSRTSDPEEDEEEEQSDEASSEHGDACALCGEAGELLCCDTCPLAYHLTCAFPPLRRVPRGNWACQVCTGADEDRARKDRVKKATIEAAQKSLRKSAKAARRSSFRSGRQRQKETRSSRKRRSPTPSPPPRTRRGQRRSSADSATKSKRRRVRAESGR